MKSVCTVSSYWFSLIILDYTYLSMIASAFYLSLVHFFKTLFTFKGFSSSSQGQGEWCKIEVNASRNVKAQREFIQVWQSVSSLTQCHSAFHVILLSDLGRNLCNKSWILTIAFFMNTNHNEGPLVFISLSNNKVFCCYLSCSVKASNPICMCWPCIDLNSVQVAPTALMQKDMGRVERCPIKIIEFDLYSTS